MLPYKRSQRVRHLLRAEVSEIIMKRIKDPRLGFLTVTDVDVTKDLKLARIYISILKDEEKDMTMQILNSARNFVRGELAGRLKTKVIPLIEFRLDDTPRYGEKIEKLLKELKEEA
jgi:ribosome-binding factor A